VNGALDGPGTGYGHAVEHPVVLVVEDEPSIRLLCRINLELEGFDVLEAGSLSEARAAIAENELSLALLDLRIGSERGTDLIEELRGRGVPVALVSGSAEHESEAEGIADAYLRKPFAIADLLRTVKELAVH
jgi:two-component system phosphate regulon response regulator PhoB